MRTVLRGTKGLGGGGGLGVGSGMSIRGTESRGGGGGTNIHSLSPSLLSTITIEAACSLGAAAGEGGEV